MVARFPGGEMTGNPSVGEIKTKILVLSNELIKVELPP